MLGKNHLHIDKADRLSDWLTGALSSAKAGSLSIDYGGARAVKVTINDGTVAVDLIEPRFFRIPDDETSLFDKLKTASEFGRKLSENETTITFLRNGKEAVRIGKNAKPTLSKLVSRSNDIQLSSVKEFTKLNADMKSD